MLRVTVLLLCTMLQAKSLHAAECATLRDYVETACDYPATLKLTSFPNKLQVDENNCNAEFNKTEWQTQPIAELSSADPSKTYTIICIDPDAPHHDKGEYFLHWVASNIAGEALVKGDLSGAKTLTGYKGPGPPKDTGLHRYIFLVFQEEEINQTVETAENRRKFGLLPWISRQTKQLCGPVAGVQFRAQH